MDDGPHRTPPETPLSPESEIRRLEHDCHQLDVALEREKAHNREALKELHYARSHKRFAWVICMIFAAGFFATVVMHHLSRLPTPEEPTPPAPTNDQRSVENGRAAALTCTAFCSGTNLRVDEIRGEGVMMPFNGGEQVRGHTCVCSR